MTHVKRISKHDDFYTPDWIIRLLIDRFNFKDSMIWDCAYGTGKIGFAFHKYLKDYVSLYGTDIRDGEDFFTFEPNFYFDFIVTNPPYSLKTEFIEKCIEYKKPFFLLMPLTTLEGLKRRKIITESDFNLTILLPDRRVQYTENNKVAFASAWFCFEPIQKNEPQLIKIELIDSSKYL